jgi:hypothetical protein
MDVHPAKGEDLPAATETIALAFRGDPVWGPALGGMTGVEDHLSAYWTFYLEGARRYDTVFTRGGRRHGVRLDPARWDRAVGGAGGRDP